MQIETCQVGELRTNCYIVTKNQQTIIIDPGDESSKIVKQCQGKNVVGILVTHHHFDHIGALETLENIYHQKHNQKIEGFPYEIITTPGHQEDCISFYFAEEKILFSGDFLFYHTIGRCDLPGSDFQKMKESIKKIMTYPPEIKIYPGHGKPTTLKEEIPYLKEYI